jgi:hypothetical protein
MIPNEMNSLATGLSYIVLMGLMIGVILPASDHCAEFMTEKELIKNKTYDNKRIKNTSLQ